MVNGTGDRYISQGKKQTREQQWKPTGRSYNKYFAVLIMFKREGLWADDNEGVHGLTSTDDGDVERDAGLQGWRCVARAFWDESSPFEQQIILPHEEEDIAYAFSSFRHHGRGSANVVTILENASRTYRAKRWTQTEFMTCHFSDIFCCSGREFDQRIDVHYSIIMSSTWHAAKA